MFTGDVCVRWMVAGEGMGQVTYTPDTNTVVLSKIFEWYQQDFGRDTAAVLEWICQWLSPEKRRQLQAAADVAVVYAPYDWSTNLPK